MLFSEERRSPLLVPFALIREVPSVRIRVAAANPRSNGTSFRPSNADSALNGLWYRGRTFYHIAGLVPAMRVQGDRMATTQMGTVKRRT
jgi:hypothetical protein